MARTPITQAQWRTLVGPEQEPLERDLNPDPSQARGARLPVECVSWYEAREWCARLNRHLGSELGEAAPRVELPSEAQWEYACRAGSTTPFHFGASISPELANYDATTSYADGPAGEYRQQTTDVASFPANAWGLHDMHGNVWEWCLDHWHSNYAKGEEEAPTDGSAWMKKDTEKDESRLLRGGSWGDIPRLCRSACRNLTPPDDVSGYIGFRVCCLPQDQLLDP